MEQNCVWSRTAALVAMEVLHVACVCMFRILDAVASVTCGHAVAAATDDGVAECWRLYLVAGLRLH